MRAFAHTGNVRVSVNPLEMDYIRYGKHPSGIRWGDRATFDFDTSGALLGLTFNGKDDVPERIKPHVLHELICEAKAMAEKFSARSA